MCNWQQGFFKSSHVGLGKTKTLNGEGLNSLAKKNSHPVLQVAAVFGVVNVAFS